MSHRPRAGDGDGSAAMSSGAVALGATVDKLPMLEVACSHRERRGRLNVARLIERHGADPKLPDLRVILAGDCPRARALYRSMSAAVCITRNWSSPSALIRAVS